MRAGEFVPLSSVEPIGLSSSALSYDDDARVGSISVRLKWAYGQSFFGGKIKWRLPGWTLAGENNKTGTARVFAGRATALANVSFDVDDQVLYLAKLPRARKAQTEFVLKMPIKFGLRPPRLGDGAGPSVSYQIQDKSAAFTPVQRMAVRLPAIHFAQLAFHAQRRSSAASRASRSRGTRLRKAPATASS